MVWRSVKPPAQLAWCAPDHSAPPHHPPPPSSLQGTADYSVQVTRTASNGNFAVSGTFRVTSLQLFPLVFFGARVQTRQLGNPSTGPRFFTAPATCTNTLFGNLVIVYPLDGFFFAPTDCR